jgi:mono/diheme cytochrome c family protein
MYFSTLIALMTLALPGQDRLRETQVSTPNVVRTVYDMREVVSPPPLSEDETAGWKLFVQRCAICHDPMGQPSYPNSLGPLLNQTTVQERGEDRVRNVIMVGSARMPGWQYALSTDQISQVMDYLKTVAEE